MAYMPVGIYPEKWFKTQNDIGYAMPFVEQPSPISFFLGGGGGGRKCYVPLEQPPISQIFFRGPESATYPYITAWYAFAVLLLWYTGTRYRVYSN